MVSLAQRSQTLSPDHTPEPSSFVLGRGAVLVDVALLIVALGCSALGRAMTAGLLPNPTLYFVTASTLVSFLLLPMAALALAGRSPLRPLSFGNVRAVLPGLLSGVVGVLAGAWALGSMQSFHGYSVHVGWHLVVATFVGMLCVEYFYRGFLLLSFYERLGWRAVVISCVPYVLGHVGKPVPELVGSLPFALWMSFLAIRSGSILYGVVLHWLLAVGINYFAFAAN
jgi:hypothetical protein